MHHEQREQTRALLRARGIDIAVFAHPHSVTWLTGFAPPVQTGPHLFAGAPPLVLYADGRFTLVVVDAWAELAALFGAEADGAVVTYLGYTVEQPIDGPGELQSSLELGWLASAASQRARIGIEESDVPAAVLRLLNSAWEVMLEPVAIDGWLKPLRMVKTAEELAKLRENFQLADVGHIAARLAVQVGASEIDVWSAAETAIQRAAGCRVPLGNDCVVGYRENNIGGWPLDYRLRPSDSLIVDLSTIRHGYWSDSCATYVAGTATAKQTAIYQVVADTLALGASLLRPGAVCADIDLALRRFIAGAGYPVYPHHSGHGVGVSGHEAPRIVPYNNERLAVGMVIMLEPGIYFPGETGVRLEDGFLITEDGAVTLTRHDKTL